MDERMSKIASGYIIGFIIVFLLLPTLPLGIWDQIGDNGLQQVFSMSIISIVIGFVINIILVIWHNELFELTEGSVKTMQIGNINTYSENLDYYKAENLQKLGEGSANHEDRSELNRKINDLSNRIDNQKDVEIDIGKIYIDLANLRARRLDVQDKLGHLEFQEVGNTINSQVRPIMDKIQEIMDLPTNPFPMEILNILRGAIDSIPSEIGNILNQHSKTHEVLKIKLTMIRNAYSEFDTIYRDSDIELKKVIGSNYKSIRHFVNSFKEYIELSQQYLDLENEQQSLMKQEGEKRVEIEKNTQVTKEGSHDLEKLKEELSYLQADYQELIRFPSLEERTYELDKFLGKAQVENSFLSPSMRKEQAILFFSISILLLITSYIILIRCLTSNDFHVDNSIFYNENVSLSITLFMALFTILLIIGCRKVVLEYHRNIHILLSIHEF